MEELDPAVFVAVFIEMLGPVLFWLLVAGIVVTTLAFFYVLIRDRGLYSRRFVRSEILGLFGGVFAILFMQFITNSGFKDIGGPIDWVLVIAIFAAGAIGTTLLAYTVWSVAGGRKPDADLDLA
jgi:hypothetical protein